MPKPSKETAERRRSEVRNATTLAALYAIERGRNYAPGWAERLHQARQEKQKPAGGLPAGFFLTGNAVDWAGL